jgi:hypothetical protein
MPTDTVEVSAKRSDRGAPQDAYLAALTLPMPATDLCTIFGLP